MERKDGYLLAEFFLTFLLLVLLTYLFKDSLSTYREYMVTGLAAGLAFSWFNRNRQNVYGRYAVNTGVLAIFIWLLISLVRSSFFYSEVITIFIQCGILLEIALSFDAASPSSLSYLQALTFPLLLCFPAFVKKYDNIHIILVLAYLVFWAAILRVKFYESFGSSRKDTGRFYSFLLSVLIFVFIIFVSWQTFSHIMMGRIDKGGFLADEGEQSKIKEGAKEKEFYQLQDGLQNEISRIIPELSSKEDRHLTLYMLSQLMKQSPDVMELNKAEKGLIDQLKRPGPGLEPGKTDEITITMEKYVNEKIAMDSSKAKGNIMNNLKNNPFRIEERISIADRLNRMQGSNTLKEINEQEKRAEMAIDKSSVNQGIKEELRGFFREVRKLKVLDLYRKQMKDFRKKADSLGGEAGEEFQKLYSALDNADRLSDLEGSRKQMRDTSVKKSKDNANLMEKANELLKLKSEMFTLRAASRFKEKLEDPGIPGSSAEELKGQADKVAFSREQDDFSAENNKLRVKMNESGVPVSQEADELSGAKIEEFTREREEAIEKLLDDSVLPDSGEEFLKAVENMESRKDTAKLDSDHAELKERLAKYYKDGFISKDSKDRLASEVEGLKELFAVKIKDDQKEGGKLGERQSVRKLADYQQELRDAIDNSSLNKMRKDSLQKLADILFKSATLEQIENVNDGVRSELDSSLNESANKQEVDSIQKKFDSASRIQRMFLIDEAFSDIMEKTNDLGRKDQDRADDINDRIEKVRKSVTPEDFRKELDKLKDYLSSQQQASSERQKASSQHRDIEKIKRMISKIKESRNLEEMRRELDKLRDYVNALQLDSLENEQADVQQKSDLKKMEEVKSRIKKIKDEDTLEDSLKKLEDLDEAVSLYIQDTREEQEKMSKENKDASWQLYILPSRLVLSVGGSASLRSIAVYRKSIIKEPAEELEWFSSNSNIAEIDQMGNVRAIAPGKANIIATYKDANSRRAQVLVVGRADLDKEDIIKKELGSLAGR